MDVNRLCIACMEESVTAGVCSACGYKQSFQLSTPNALPPQTILNGKYFVGKVLGHGGFGITYIALDLERNEKVAIKEFMPEGVVTRAAGTTVVSVFMGEKRENFRYGSEKFLDEARMIYKYNSNPNIISVYELFEENGTAYYVMEYLKGMDLKQYLAEKGGKLTFEEMIKIFRPVFTALKTIHKDGLIHRDISPDNIYISSNMQIKLLDFGAARYAMGEKSQNLSVILKLGYAPEEQCRTKGQQGPWTDIYALGSTIYHMLTGEKPPEAFDRAAEDTLVKPSRRGVLIPDYAETALLKAMAVYGKNRFQTVEEFEKAITGAVIVAEPVNRNNRWENIYSVQPLQPIQPKYGYEVQYAGFWKRCIAIIIDMIIMGVVGAICSYIDSSGLLIIILSWLYFAVLESSSKQGTLGKQAIGLIVTDLQKNRITFGRATMRYFSKIISAITLCIGYIMAGTTEKKQALHDILAGTLVVLKDGIMYEQPVEYPAINQSINPQQIVSTNQNFKPYLKGVSGFFAGMNFPLENGSVTIGRNYNVCQIVFPENTPGVSAIHCLIYYDEASKVFMLVDQGSSCGTFLGSGSKISFGEPISLKSGEVFYIGEDNKFEVECKYSNNEWR